MTHEVPPHSSTRLTAHIGLVLTLMLAAMFASGGFFFLFTFNYDLPPWFVPVRFLHFYVGLASIPFLLAKYGTTSVRRLNDHRAILATHVNGAPLSTNHGFPVRLIVPGYPGQNMVKQIERIFVRGNVEEFRPDFRLVKKGTPEEATA